LGDKLPFTDSIDRFSVSHKVTSGVSEVIIVVSSNGLQAVNYNNNYY